MRAGVILRMLSRMLGFTVFSLAVPMLVSLGYREWRTAASFGIAGALAAMLAYGLAHLPAAVAAPRNTLLRREGFLAVTMGWIVLVLFNAVAFHLTGAFAGFAETVFEAMSGFTTTGATVVAAIEDLPKGVLFSRSFSHWIGGMGIIVLSVAILPELQVGGMQLMAAEASGIDSDKLAPRIAGTARRLWGIYVAITAVEVVLLLPPMGVFDAINHAMATIATGGFSTKNTSIAAFDSVYVEVVILVFMWISGLNFTLQARAVADRSAVPILRSPEARLYAWLTGVAIALIVISLYAGGRTLGNALRHGSFQVVSIITTTGFGTDDFDRWPHFARLLMVALMLVGACAGSTAGGFKVIRLYVVAKHALLQLHRLIRPRLVETLHIGERTISRETAEGVMGYSLLYFALLLAASLAMTALGMDLISGSTAAVSALNSIGPGLGTVGAAQNFGGVPDAGLYILSLAMLLGRLEIYPMLVLFTAHFWRRG